MVVKTVDNFLENFVSQVGDKDNYFVEKMIIYHELNDNKNINFNNSYEDSYNLQIYNKKSIIKIADFNIYRTPDVFDSETGKLLKSNVCFDNTGKPLPIGTQVLLHPGEKIVYAKQSVFNAKDYFCGYYGVSSIARAPGGIGDTSGRNHADARRSLVTPVLSTETKIDRNVTGYYTYENFLENGYIEKELFCYKDENNITYGTSLKNCKNPYLSKFITVFQLAIISL